MENHPLFKWENSLFLWPYSIAMLVITRGYLMYFHQTWPNLDTLQKKNWLVDNPIDKRRLKDSTTVPI